MSIIKVNTINPNTGATVTVNGVTVAANAVAATTIDATNLTVATAFTSPHITDNASSIAVSAPINVAGITSSGAASFQSTLLCTGNSTFIGSINAQGITTSTLSVGGATLSSDSPILFRAWGELTLTFDTVTPSNIVTAALSKKFPATGGGTLTVATSGANYVTITMATVTGTGYIVMCEDDKTLGATNLIHPYAASHAATSFRIYCTNSVAAAVRNIRFFATNPT